MLKKLVSLPFLVAATSFASADTFRFDGRVFYGSSEIDSFYGDSLDVDVMGVAGAMYFKDVDTNGLLLGEAAFLNHASSIGVLYAEAEMGDFESSTTTLNGEFYVPQTVLYLGVDYTDAEGSDDEDIDITAGFYKDNLRVTTTYNEDVDYELNVLVKYVIVNNDGTGWDLGAGFQKVDEGDDVVQLEAEYFFTPAVSVGLGYQTDGEDDITTVEAEVFVTERVYFSALYSDSEFIDNYMLSAGLRF
ncbi:hypothetical protein TDB9533_03735 [Thalassocella blandensis]|nr:hypothetical protein TDB9533_03735 [Thalassocella blandensis]